MFISGFPLSSATESSRFWSMALNLKHLMLLPELHSSVLGPLLCLLFMKGRHTHYFLTTVLCTGKFNVIKIAYIFKRIYHKLRSGASKGQCLLTWENVII